MSAPVHQLDPRKLQSSHSSQQRDFGAELKEAERAAKEAALQAGHERVRISDDDLEQLAKAAVEKFKQSPIAKEYSFRRKEEAFNKLLRMLEYGDVGFEDAHTALFNAHMPFDITEVLERILLYHVLNVCDRHPRLKRNYPLKGPGRKFLEMWGRSKSGATDKDNWWIQQMDLPEKEE